MNDMATLPAAFSFDVAQFWSPSKRRAAVKLVAASTQLIVTLNNLRSDNPLTDDETAELENRQEKISAQLRACSATKPLTQNDIIEKMRRQSDLLLSLQDLLTIRSATEVSNSRQIFGAKAAFIVASEELLKRPAFLKADRELAKTVDISARHYVSQHCAGLQNAIVLGCTAEIVRIEALFGSASLTVVSLQAERPHRFGKAYEQQPVYVWDKVPHVA